MSDINEKIIDQKKGIMHKMIPEMRVAGFLFRSGYEELRTLVPSRLAELETRVGGFICGPPMILLDYGVHTDAVHVEAVYPVSSAAEKEGIRNWTLSPASVLSVVHRGPHDKLDESYKKLYGYMREHSEPGTAYGREIYIRISPSNPEDNITEVQAILHGWQDRFMRNATRVLGEKTARQMAEGHESLFTLQSSKEEKKTWIKNTMEKLDKIANECQKYDILSCCAHEFSDIRISRLKDVYEKTGSVDAVIEFMGKDCDWYEAPRRKGNIIYVTKVPYNRKAYEEAKTRDEKRKSYCHCGLVRDFLDSGISHTFCNCSAGWYRQQWGGLLGKPVFVKIIKTLLTGDDTCEFAIHLPEGVVENQKGDL